MLLWGTDFHLDHLVTPDAVLNFGKYLADENPDCDGIIITGDIGTGTSFPRLLTEFKEGFQKDVYVVLGNHDYFYGSFENLDRVIAEHPDVHHLTSKPLVIDDVAIVGSEGWYDFMLGNEYTPVELEDMFAITDLDKVRTAYANFRSTPEAKESFERVKEACRKRSEYLASNLYKVLDDAIEPRNILICTHVPPYAGATWYRGEVSNNDWLPWFSSKKMGEAIETFASINPGYNVKVICGHCHSSGYYKSPAGVEVYTGRAKFRNPDVCGLVYTNEFEVKQFGV